MFSQFICTSIRKFVFVWNFNIQWSKYNQGVFKNTMYSKGQRRCVIFSYSFSVLKYNVLKHNFFFRWVQIKCVWGGGGQRNISVCPLRSVHMKQCTIYMHFLPWYFFDKSFLLYMPCNTYVRLWLWIAIKVAVIEKTDSV